jgi:hypothetical protein
MALPVNWDTITLTGTFIDLSGAALAGTISFASGSVVKDPASDVIVYPKTLQATLNGSGHFSIVLPRTNDPDIEPEFVYTVTENFAGQGQRTYQLTLGTELGPGPVDLADLAQLATQSEVAFASHIHSNPLHVDTIRIWWGSTDPGGAAQVGDFWVRPAD